MAKGRKSVALFEVITAQQGKGNVERVPRPSFWKRLGLRRKPKLDLLGKAEQQPAAVKSKEDDVRHQERLKKAAALKLAQERAAARAAKRAKADAREAEKLQKKKQREEARAAMAAAAERVAAERAAAEKAARAEAARAAAEAARKSAEPAEPRPSPSKAAAPTAAPSPPMQGPLQMLRGIAKIDGGRLVLTFDWVTGSLAAAAVLLLCLGFLAIGSAIAGGDREARPGSAAASVDPLAGQGTDPAAAGLSATDPDAGRVRPGEAPQERPSDIVFLTASSREDAANYRQLLADCGIQTVVVQPPGRAEYTVVYAGGVRGLSDEPSVGGRQAVSPPQGFRFQRDPNYIVVVTTSNRDLAAKCQRFLLANGISAVIVPIGGGKHEVVCTEGVTGLSDPRCGQLAAAIRALGAVLNASPQRLGTDFSRLYLKKGTHYVDP